MHSVSRRIAAWLFPLLLGATPVVRAQESVAPDDDSAIDGTGAEDANAIPGNTADANDEAVEEDPPINVTEMLDPDDIPDNSADLSTDVDRWALRDVLENNFAASEDWKANLNLPTNDLAPLTLPSLNWQQSLEERRLLSLLSGQPEQHHHLDMAGLQFDIPLSTHPLVDVYIDYFTGRGRFFFQTWLARAARYTPVMQRILAEKGVPQDLVYLAMIESGFSAKAYSTASAAGYWQFIGSTGKIFGLKRDMWVDERRDFIRSTEAAASYLALLHKDLGDWHLAWAGYNAGEGRIRRALNKYQERDFWGLISHKKSLAKETVHYVPKIIAAAIVAKDAERYGFKLTDVPVPVVFDEIRVTDATDLRVIAKQSKVPLEELRELNPALLHDITPPGRIMNLRVPKGQAETITAQLAALPPTQRFTYQSHRVKRGDTLSGIARRYRSDIDTIKVFNHMRNTLLRPGQDLIVPSLYTTKNDPMVASRPTSAPAKSTRSASAKAPTARHVVGSGETLWSIARRYGVTVDRIQHRSRRGSQIVVGEVLEIF